MKESVPPKASSAEEVSLETRMAALRASVKRLEQGGGDLDQAFQDFEEGMKHARALHAALESMDRRIEKVIAENQAVPLAEESAVRKKSVGRTETADN